MSNYYKVKALSSSALSCLDFELGGSPQKFKDFLDGKLESEESYFRTGSMIHLAVLEPEKFVVADIERPSDAICKIIENLYEVAQREAEVNYEEIQDITYYQPELLEILNQCNYQLNWKPQTRIDKVTEVGKEYFEYLHKCKTSEEIILTSQEYGLITACAASLKTDPHISRVMFPVDLPEGIEILREEEFYFQYEGLDCKAKLDQLILNHNNKTFNLIDLKTTSKPINNFPDSFKHFRYDKQLAFYTIAVQSRYPDYTLNLSAIAAVETTGYNRARLFNVPTSVMEQGTKKIQELVAQVKYCQQTGNWVYEPDYVNEPYTISLV